MRYTRLIGSTLIVLISMAALARAADRPAPVAVPTTVPTTQPVIFEPIPRADLERMYRAELGEKLNPADLPKLYEAHGLIEQYFVATSAGHRASIIAQINAMSLDPNLLGRITRLRINWPVLPGGVYYVNEMMGPHQVRYFIGVPEGYDRTVSWPLVIKLPTVHAFLTRPPPDANGVVAIYSQWINDELHLHPDALVLMPLLNLDELYGPSYQGMNSVIQPMMHAAGRVNIDPARVYIIGHSMSAHAAWNLALHYSTYFAAINPLAGGATEDWQRLRVINLCNILPVVWHDADDPVIKVDESRSIVKQLRKMNLDVDYEETTKLGHAPSPEVVTREYGKLRARVRELYPRQVAIQSNRPDTMFNRIDWVQVYQPINSGPERRVFFPRSGDHMILYQNSFRIDATIPKPNKITAKADNVESLRFYLNDQLVDLKRPVTILINGKSKYEGMVQPSLEEMLKDQLFLGRGWRYYTAVVDIDLGPAPTTSSTTGPTTGPATAAPGTIEIVTPDGNVKTIDPKKKD